MYENTLRISEGEERKWMLNRVSGVTTQSRNAYLINFCKTLLAFIVILYSWKRLVKVSDIQIIAREEVEPQNPFLEICLPTL